MKLEAAWLRRYHIPLKTPLRTARGFVKDREGALLVLADERGVMGLGDVAPLPTHAPGALDAALDDVQRAWGSLAERRVPDALSLLDPLGIAPAARAALASAILDLEAKRRDVPLAAVLAEDHAPSVAVNALVADLAEARRVAGEGWPVLKAKAGAASDAPGLAAALRDAARGLGVRLDANGAWSVAEAEAAMRAMDVDYVEQPVAPHDLRGLARLREVGRVAADEAASTLAGARAVLAADAADVLVLKPSLLGGPDLCVRLAAEARAAGVDVVVTTAMESVVGRLAALHAACAIPDVLPAGLDTGRFLAFDLAEDPAAPRAGRARLPDTAGLGVDIQPLGGRRL